MLLSNNDVVNVQKGKQKRRASRRLSKYCRKQAYCCYGKGILADDSSINNWHEQEAFTFHFHGAASFFICLKSMTCWRKRREKDDLGTKHK